MRIPVEHFKKLKAKPKHPESELQRECVKWFRLTYPKQAGLLFAIPNGGKRSKFEAAIMKGEGVTAGVADLMLAIPKPFTDGMVSQYHGLFIEMKHGKGKQTPAQIIFEKSITEQGYKYVVCNTFDNFVQTITNYLK